MGGFISVIICIAAAILLYGTGHPVLLGMSVAAGVICFWSWGVMHNHAMARAKARRDLILANMLEEGRSAEDVAAFDARVVNPMSSDINAVPNWLAALSLIATVVGVLLLFSAALIRWR